MSARKNRILVIDIDQEARALLAANLRQATYEVIEAGSTQQASEVLVRSQLDIVLLDLTPPCNSGLALCSWLREEMGESVVIVLICHGTTSRERVVGLEMGADDVVDKQMDTEELSARLEAHHRRRQLSSNEAYVDGDDDTEERTVKPKSPHLNHA